MTHIHSHTTQLLDEAEIGRELPDFIRYHGALYARLAVIVVAPDFSQSAVEVAAVKRNLNRECLHACERRNLRKGLTIPPAMKYEIAVEIGIVDVGELGDFKAGQSAYQHVSRMMADAGYSAKRKGDG